MTIQRTFRKQGEKAVASFDFTDIAEGTGVVVLNGFTSAISGAIYYDLSTSELHSELIQTKTAQITAAGEALKNTCNFDLPAFNLPRTIKGTAMISIPFSGTCVDVGGACGGHLRVYVQKGSPTFATIANAQTEHSGYGGQSIVEDYFTIPITLPETHFKKGDVLRVKVEIWGNGDAANGGYLAIGHDPQNRIDTMFETGNDTKFTASIPFKLDL